MKKIFATTIAFAALSAAMGQIGKGSLFLGVDLNFYSSNNEQSSTAGGTTTTYGKYSYSYWNFGPSGQYFFADNMAVGLSLGLGQSKSVNENPTNKDKTTNISKNQSVNLFLRKYWGMSDAFYFFGELKFGMTPGSGSSEMYDGQAATTTKFTSKSSSTNIGLNAGLAWMATDKIMFTGSIGMLGWNSYKNKYSINEPGDSYQTSKGSGFGLSFSTGYIPFNLGFAYRIMGGQ